jgi:hypothetical protein
MTREEHDRLLAELDLPYEQRQQLKEQREREREQRANNERNLTDAEMARWSAHFGDGGNLRFAEPDCGSKPQLSTRI